MLSRFVCYTKLDENTLEHSYKVIPKCLIFDLRFMAVVGIFSWSLDLCRVDNLYSRPLSSLLLCFKKVAREHWCSKDRRLYCALKTGVRFLYPHFGVEMCCSNES